MIVIIITITIVNVYNINNYNNSDKPRFCHFQRQDTVQLTYTCCPTKIRDPETDIISVNSIESFVTKLIFIKKFIFF